MAIYDCFLFNDENTILEIRLNELNKYVDYFVIIESKFNHQNKVKNQKINNKLLQKFKEKIIYKYIDKNFNNFSSWEIENFQRNYIFNSLKQCNSNDIVLISDLDEIPNLTDINFSEIKNEVLAFSQIHTMYKLNLLRERNWIGTKLCRFKNLKSPQWLRNLKTHKSYPFYRIDKKFFSKTYYKNIKIIQNGGWHFGWLRNTDQILEKIKSFAHTEFLKSKLNNRDHIETCVKNNINFINNEKLEKLDTLFLPSYIQKNLENYKDFLDF